jgi:hypothetical protein
VASATTAGATASTPSARTFALRFGSRLDRAEQGKRGDSRSEPDREFLRDQRAHRMTHDVDLIHPRWSRSACRSSAQSVIDSGPSASSGVRREPSRSGGPGGTPIGERVDLRLVERPGAAETVRQDGGACAVEIV